jgi:hypothetical protein
LSEVGLVGEGEEGACGRRRWRSRLGRGEAVAVAAEEEGGEWSEAWGECLGSHEVGLGRVVMVREMGE